MHKNFKIIYRTWEKVETELRSVLADALCQFPKTLAELAKNEQAEAEGSHKPITGKFFDFFISLVLFGLMRKIVLF